MGKQKEIIMIRIDFRLKDPRRGIPVTGRDFRKGVDRTGVMETYRMFVRCTNPVCDWSGYRRCKIVTPMNWEGTFPAGDAIAAIKGLRSYPPCPRCHKDKVVACCPCGPV